MHSKTGLDICWSDFFHSLANANHCIKDTKNGDQNRTKDRSSRHAQSFDMYRSWKKSRLKVFNQARTSASIEASYTSGKVEIICQNPTKILLIFACTFRQLTKSENADNRQMNSQNQLITEMMSLPLRL